MHYIKSNETHKFKINTNYKNYAINVDWYQNHSLAKLYIEVQVKPMAGFY